MVDCISASYKIVLENLISKQVAHEVMGVVLQSMPNCEPLPSTLSAEGRAQVASLRKGPEMWNIKVDYTDEHGHTESMNSPSDVVKKLGLKMSGQQITCDGEKCTALSVVDILRLQGFTVACEDEQGLTLDCKKAGAGGKAMHVFHPMLKPKAASKLSEEIRGALKLGKTYEK